jgi:hypothetical protein
MEKIPFYLRLVLPAIVERGVVQNSLASTLPFLARTLVTLARTRCCLASTSHSLARTQLKSKNEKALPITEVPFHR